MLSKALVSSSTLEFVSFAQSKLGDSGIEAIAMALGKCPNLQQLNLTGCHLTDKASDHISKIITLHGVLKDEDVWSSSLRGESVSAVASRPALLLDLSQNALGDESAQALCNALYHDKWLLGLNLGQNRISRNGITLLIDTLTQSNRTLAALVVANMKDSVDHVNQRKLDTLMHQRRRVLQHLAFESREKRLVLCSLLLEWNVERDLVLEICQSSSSNESQSGIHASRLDGHSASSSAFSPSLASSSRSSAASVASSSQVWTKNNAAVVGEEDFAFEHGDLEIDATDPTAD
uniref:Uncharacterized protein n=1 Tax=Globisporangium ultimum (strain ATCC 200006 / CBS 805.95 / DAOM BR144) TaxID=431595 RepID=K3W6K8_GLOUD